MSDKMRRYMPVIAFWILVILSAFHFALAAPVAVREVLEVRSNAVGVLKDGIAAWEKRMDSGDEGQWSTNEGHQKTNDPGNDSGHSGENAALPGSPSGDWEPETMSNGRGPHPYYNKITDLYSGEDDKDSDHPNGYGSDDNKSGYEADYDSEGDHSMQSSQGSVKSTSPGPQSERPATPESLSWLEDLLRPPESLEEPLALAEALFKDSPKIRPRNSGSGAVGTPKRELQGIVDTKVYVPVSSLPLQATQFTNILTPSSMVRARATSASSVHDPPGRCQN